MSYLSVFSLQIGVLATLLTTISGVVSVDDIWGDEWDILLVSLQVRTTWLCIRLDACLQPVLLVFYVRIMILERRYL